MKKLTPGQAALGFFAIFFTCLFLSSLISSLDPVLEVIALPSLLLSIFFLSLALAIQVKDRGQMPIATVITGSSFLSFVVPAILLVIGSLSPPDLNETLSDPVNELNQALSFLKVYGAVFSVFFFSSIAGLLVSSKSLIGPGNIVTKISFLSVIISLVFTLFLIFGVVSFIDNIQWLFIILSLTLALVALSGIFRLELKKPQSIKESISFDNDRTPPSLNESKPTILPPPNQSQPTVASMPDQSKPTFNQAPAPASPKADVSPLTEPLADLENKTEDSVFASNLTQLDNPVFKEIKKEDSNQVKDLSDKKTVKPGWYSDPADQNFIRYFDGESWTNHRQPKG